MKAGEAESRICHPFQRLPCFLLWVQSVTREPPLIRRAVKASPRPSMAQSEESGASTSGQPGGLARLGSSATQDLGDKCLFTSITCSRWLVETQKPVGPQAM